MVAALYSSRDGGKKCFFWGGSQFGWKAVQAVYNDEMERAKQNVMRRVPGLKRSHVYRDVWTRLNVAPAKIMQVINDKPHYPFSIKFCY